MPRAGYFRDNVYCHVASGLGAGFVAVCVGSPVDVIKSRMMGGWRAAQRACPGGGRPLSFAWDPSTVLQP